MRLKNRIDRLNSNISDNNYNIANDGIKFNSTATVSGD